MKKSCFSLVFWVLLTLFKGVEADDDESGPSSLVVFLAVILTLVIPILVISVIVFFCCLCCYCQSKQNRRKDRRWRHSFIHSRPSQHPGYNSSHAEASGAGCVPNTRERQRATANPIETLTVRLPPLHSGEQPSLPFNVEGIPPPYFGEEPPPPYSGEEHSSLPSRGEPPPSYSGEEPPSPYAVTSLV
ncbi:uncharacterized protein LOC144654436 [Oculina patagonica]